MTAARATIADVITATMVDAPAITARFGARVKKAPTLRIDHHRSVECPDTRVFRIGGI
jgi:hypothetical protein